MPSCCNQAAAHSLSFCPFWHTTTTDLSRYSAAHCETEQWSFTHGPGKQTRIGSIVVVDPDVDDGRRLGNPYKARKLWGGDEGGRWHGVPFPHWEWTRYFSRSLTGQSRTTPCSAWCHRLDDRARHVRGRSLQAPWASAQAV
jgi:hypothetical protein